MNILAIDPGTTVGWATQDANGIHHGTQVFDLRRGESIGMRWLRFDVWLAEMYKLSEFKLIVFEQAHHRGGAASSRTTGWLRL